MSWLRLDDGFAEHPKVLELPLGARWGWLEVLLYCARRRTRGLVTWGALERCGFGKSEADELVALGLLELDDEGAMWVHDWHVYNGAKSDAERQREARARKYGADYRGEPVGDHGGRRGSYPQAQTGMAPSSHERHDDVTGGKRDGSVTTHARGPQPLEDTYSSTELKLAAAGWVDNLSSYTGCRWVRGTHAGGHTYDPLGIDRPPDDWPHPRPTRQEIVAALAEKRELEAE